MSKTCRKCNVEKPFYLFYKCSVSKDGCGVWCKECYSEYNKINRPIYRAKRFEKMRLKEIKEEEVRLKLEKLVEKQKYDNFHERSSYLSSVAREAISSIWWQSR